MNPTFSVLPMLEYASAKVGEMRTSVWTLPVHVGVCVGKGWRDENIRMESTCPCWSMQQRLER